MNPAPQGGPPKLCGGLRLASLSLSTTRGRRHLRLRWRRFSVQFGGLAKVGSGSDYAASLCSGLALSGASPG